jgi:hypothetical protein
MVYKMYLNKVSGYIYYKYSTTFHMVRAINYNTSLLFVIHDVTLEIIPTVSIKIMVLMNVTPCCFVDVH